jgi:AraC-like DNA-binding protein
LRAQHHTLTRKGEAADRRLLSVRGLDVHSDDSDIKLISLVIARAVRTAASELGVVLDVPALDAVDAGLTDPSHAMPCSELGALLHKVAERLDDPYAGFRLATRITPHRLHFIGPMLLTSSTLQQACERFQLVRRMVVGGPSWVLESEADTVYFGHRVRLDRQHAELVAQFTATLAHQLAATFVGPGHAHTLQLRLALPEPPEGSRPLPLPHGVVYGSELNGISIAREEWLRPRPSSDASFAEAYDEFVRARYLSDLADSTWATRVRQALLTSAHPQRIELLQLSASWQLSERTARRRLKNEGTQYRALREEVCMELALKWIVLDGLESKQVAEKLGYLEVNSLRRSFRRHFGATPAKIREDYLRKKERAADDP